MRVAMSKSSLGILVAIAVVAGITPVLAQPNFQPSQGFSNSQICPTAPNTPCALTVNGGTIDSGDAVWTPNVPESTTVLRLTENSPNERGSVWFNTPQPVTRAWTSTFQFQLTSGGSGDGLAFVIQNSGLDAIGGFGGGMGYATRCNDNSTPCTPAGSDTGITKSVAIEFDTFQNLAYDPSSSHIAIQSCGSDPNSPDHNECNLALPVNTVNLADGATHTVRIDYIPCDGECDDNLFVYLDNAPNPVVEAFVNFSSLLNLGDGDSAYVGFTAATKGATESHDILNWTFSPSQTQTVDDTPKSFDFNGGPDGGGYSYTTQLASGQEVQVKVAPVLKTQAECNALVNLNPLFTGAQCMVYDNADGANGISAVMFEVTCPERPDSKCDTTDSNSPFDAELGTEFTFELANNLEFSKTLPLPGWLKGEGPDSTHPCSPNPDNTTPLFQSNQIESFVIVGDPRATTKGTSGGTGSCWVATYNTPHVEPSVSVTTPASTTYNQGANIPSSFSCTTVNTLDTNSNSPIGPYLTLSGCTATNDGSPIIFGDPINTSTTGVHKFIATVLDSGSDTKKTQEISYTVIGNPGTLISPSSMNYGTVYLNKNVKQTFTVTNNGTGPLKFTKVAITPGSGPGAKDFTTQNNTCTGTLNPNQSCSVVVLFNVDHVGSANATLFFTDNAPGSPQGVSLTANVINPKISISTTTVSFGTHKVNSTSSKTVVLKSSGTTVLNFASIVLGGTNSADFTKSGCTSSTLAAGASCNLTVTFKPIAKGSRSAFITITDNALNSPQKITLTGTGN